MLQSEKNLLKALFMDSIFNCLTSNCTVTHHKNSYLIKKKGIIHKRPNIVISHGSSGLSISEIDISNTFLDQGFIVQLIDHFKTFSKKKFNWGYRDKYIDKEPINIEQLYRSLDCLLPENNIHLGFSLGGYLGLAFQSYFQKVYSFYPGYLPFDEQISYLKWDNIKIYIPENDNWCLIPKEIQHFIPTDNIVIVNNCFHGFMSSKKDKVAHVSRYHFIKQFYPLHQLSKININYEGLDNISNKCDHIEVRIKSNNNCRQRIINQIIEDNA